MSAGVLTFPAPVDPATASIFPFSRYRLMFLRTGVTYRLVKKRPGSLFMCPFALFSCLIFSNNSLIPCSRIYSASGHCFVCIEDVDKVSNDKCSVVWQTCFHQGQRLGDTSLKRCQKQRDSPKGEHFQCPKVWQWPDFTASISASVTTNEQFISPCFSLALSLTPMTFYGSLFILCWGLAVLYIHVFPQFSFKWGDVDASAVKKVNTHPIHLWMADSRRRRWKENWIWAIRNVPSTVLWHEDN